MMRMASRASGVGRDACLFDGPTELAAALESMTFIANRTRRSVPLSTPHIARVGRVNRGSRSSCSSVDA